jgi:hypothetical protein
MAKWLALVLCIFEIPGSNLGPDISYPDRGVSCFSSVPPSKFRDSTLNYATAASQYSLSNSFSLMILSV